MTITTRTVRANGLAFAVDEAGEGDRLALCLHGFPESRFSWRAQMPVLADLGYRVWAPDLRGYGETEPKPQDVDSYRMERLLEDVAALIDAAGAREVMLVAHDWGAAVAWTFAARKVRPLSRMVIMNLPHPAVFGAVLRRSPRQMLRSWYLAFFQIPGLPERMLLARDARAIRRAFSDMAKDKGRFPEAVLDRYAMDAQRPGAMTGMVNWYRAAARHPDFMREPWAKIEIPTLVIWGEADAALGLETLEGTEAYVSDLRIERLPGVSHWVQQEAPEAVNSLLVDWLKD
ncbi:alpha/beta fold hydrolase [Phenylobacterium sp.]|uniref:alpha/beta fold hydrolase n=1 Tax=Phenylobacterium sp. TaxID=1871053 RepID=UPI00272F531B|nr:alpha/beta hydrolase [Phenylobacterium sp.]MDP2213665.1 alpha/beta hydrolase [Phenylobacterium sp.]